jgi:hypothetical protein
MILLFSYSIWKATIHEKFYSDLFRFFFLIFNIISKKKKKSSIQYNIYNTKNIIFWFVLCTAIFIKCIKIWQYNILHYIILYLYIYILCRENHCLCIHYLNSIKFRTLMNYNNIKTYIFFFFTIIIIPIIILL